MTYLSEEPTAADLCGFLATVSRHLAASLDFEATLLTIAGMALPYMDSWCIVTINDADGVRRPIAVVHPDADKQVHASRVADVMVSGEDIWSVLMPGTGGDGVGEMAVTEERIASIPGSEQCMEDLRALGIGSYITRSLFARNTVLGSITFVSAAASRVYTADDVALAEDLASRCAMALDNSRLYTEAEESRSLAEHINERLLVATLEQQEMAEQARDANLAKSQFLAMMSHELRTPLNAIVGYADLIDLGIGGAVTSEQRRYIEKIHSSTHHLVGIVDDILDLAKIQAGRLDIRSEPMMLDTVMDAAVTLVGPQAAAAGLRLEMSTRLDAMAACVGDENRVRQILVNLLANAVKFTAPGGVVSVSCESFLNVAAAVVPAGAGPRIVFRVTDTGVGITDEEKAAIFKPFVQLESGKIQQRGGTGLGLTISRELARRMGGDLTVVSTPGKGSTFSLWLPVTGLDDTHLM